MERKRIAMFLKHEWTSAEEFLSVVKPKRNTYLYFFKKGTELGFDMYLVGGMEKYKGELNFEDGFLFNGEKFVVKRGLFSVDAVYDRTGGLDFPRSSMDKKVLNQLEFKKICWDKYLMYELLGRFMPDSYMINSQKELVEKLEKFSPDDMVVLKPINGLKGEDVVIDFARVVATVSLKVNCAYILQEFVDTSGGIKGLAAREHDLRVVVANEKIVFSHVRSPQKGSFVANAAQGGKIKEVPPEMLPSEVVAVVKEVQKKIDSKFNNPIYSIDFGIANDRPYVFEINDTIGFPTDKMKNAKNFIDNVLKSLQRLSQI